MQLGEMLAERLDYEDDVLMEAVYHFYEFLMDNQETIHLRELAQTVLNAIAEPEEDAMGMEEEPQGKSVTAESDWSHSNAKAAGKRKKIGEAWTGTGGRMERPEKAQTETAMKSTAASGRRERKGGPEKAGRGKKENRPSEPSQDSGKEKREKKTSGAEESQVHEKYKKSLLAEMLLLLGVDVCSVFLVSSDNIAVLFFQIAAAVICPVMIGRQLWYRKKELAGRKTGDGKQPEIAEE
ncbi:MAG: hypothetical protein LUE87_09345 [Lachnospiraceae bacterium]|nr:hypothetical protein [Lachnospiraceae bacterium]